jgi:hypothetical protein
LWVTYQNFTLLGDGWHVRLSGFIFSINRVMLYEPYALCLYAMYSGGIPYVI